jgi:hypothetical protein
MKVFFVLPAFSCLFALAACGGNAWEREQRDLVRRAAEIEDRHCRLKASIDSLWDATALQLDRALPRDFPAADRAIFIKARNADHIRMFMSFEKVDPAVRQLVDAAGKQDAILAAQLHFLLEQRRDFERSKLKFLSRVQRRDEATGKRYADQLRTAAASGQCPM